VGEHKKIGGKEAANGEQKAVLIVYGKEKS